MTRGEYIEMERGFLIQVPGRWMNGWIQPSQPPNVEEDDEGFLLETASSSSSRQRIPDVTMYGVVGYDCEPKIASVYLGEDGGYRQMDDITKRNMKEVRNLSYTSHSKLHASNGRYGVDTYLEFPLVTSR